MLEPEPVNVCSPEIAGPLSVVVRLVLGLLLNWTLGLVNVEIASAGVNVETVGFASTETSLVAPDTTNRKSTRTACRDERS